MKKFATLFFILYAVIISAFAEDIKTTSPVIITAEKFDEDFGNVQKTEFTEKDISSNPSKNIVDVAASAPNVERAGSVRASNSEFRIRGMEDTRVTTKIDGSKTNFRGEYKGRNFISPFMLSGISLSRGSNSVLDGSGAIAGSVDLKTKDVEDIRLREYQTFGGELFSSYGSNGYMQNYAGSAFAIKDGFSLLGLYSFSSNNDFKTSHEVPISGTESKTDNGIIKLKKHFSSEEFIEFYSSIFKETGESTSNPFRLTTAGELVNRDITNIREAFELNLAFLNLKAFYDKTNITEDLIAGTRRDTTDFTSYGFNLFGKYSYKAKSMNNMFIYGVDFIKDDQSGERGGAPNRASIFPSGTSRNEGVFLENAFEYKRLKMLIGGRVDYYTLQSGGESISYNSGLLKKASIGYEVIEGLTPFVRYAEGYRAPFLKETFASGSIVSTPFFSLNLASNKDLNAEYSKNYEVGFKFVKDFYNEGDGFFLDGIYFVQDIEDFIIQDPNCTPATCNMFPTSFLFQYQNLEKVRFHGLEGSLKLKYNGYLFAIGASTLNAYETKNDNNLLQIPHNKLIITVGKKFENGLFVGLESISANSVGPEDFRTYSFPVTPFFGIPAGGILNTNCEAMRLCEETKGYSILNANIEYTKKLSKMEYKIGSSFNNIFDVYYKQQSSFIPDLGRNIMFYGQVRF